MYLRVTERRNRDGSTVAYYALAENHWNAEAKRSETRVIHSFGRTDQLDRATLQRLVAEIEPWTVERRTPNGLAFRVDEVLLVHDCGPDDSDRVIESLATVCETMQQLSNCFLFQNF